MINKYLIIILILLALGGGLLLNKNSQTNPANNNKLLVTASFYPLYFFASEIAGDKADVKNITPLGTEPHDYEPTAQDIARLEKSKLLIINGAGFEPWVEKLESGLTQKNVRIVDASLELELHEGEDEHAKDPHVWLDPLLAKQQVEKITQGFRKIDPTNRSHYDAKAKKLTQRLDQLDALYKQGLSNCQQKDIITSHSAFGYLAARYGLTQISITGLSPNAEPSSWQLANVADFAKEHNVKYIFFESLVSPKLAETLANEINAKTLVLDPIEGLSDDERKQGKNYFTVMEDNLKNLQQALQCSR